ncbi:MAG TPA: substrate-binding domain-containing protein, partial [Chloroflexota bacterium]
MFGTRSRTSVRGVLVALALTAWATAPALADGPATTTYGQAQSGKITIAGSSALQPLIDQAAKSYQAANPNVQITVSAGGSGAGRSGACQGSLDIGMSDVPLTDQEISSLNCADANQTAVAIEAFAVAANTRGPGSLGALT